MAGRAFLWVIAGGPGSGKTWILREYVSQLCEPAVVIDYTGEWAELPELPAEHFGSWFERPQGVRRIVADPETVHRAVTLARNVHIVCDEALVVWPSTGMNKAHATELTRAVTQHRHRNITWAVATQRLASGLHTVLLRCATHATFLRMTHEADIKAAAEYVGAQAETLRQCEPGEGLEWSMNG